MFFLYSNMKYQIYIIGLFLLLFEQKLTAQQVVTYRNQYWMPCKETDALYVSINEPEKGLWHRKDYFIQNRKIQMDGFFKDSANTIKQGRFYYFFPNTQLQTIADFDENKKNGAFISFYPNGMMQDSFHFKQDIPLGTCSGWYPNGVIRMEMQMDTIGKGKGLAIGFFENGNVSFKGLLNEGLRKSGNWFYYHENGNKASVLQYPKTDSLEQSRIAIKHDSFENIYYDSNAVYSNVICYNQDGVQQENMKLLNRGPEFKGGLKAWTSYLEDKMYEISRTLSGSPGYINLTYRAYFMINSKGATYDVQVDNAVEAKLDLKVGDIIRDSRNWIPAVHNNRIIPYMHVQSMTFKLTMN